MAHSFKGGVRPHYKKEHTFASPIEAMKPSDILFFPLIQHQGSPCTPIVKIGDRVLLGQKIADSEDEFSAPIHSSVSGRVIAIEPRPVISGKLCMCIAIENDFFDEQLQNALNIEDKPIGELTTKEIIAIAREAGIVGMGGKAFPTHYKLLRALAKKVSTLIINGTECEPYITADHRAMIEYPRPILSGIHLIMQCLNIKKCFVGIEDNKEDAIATMKSVSRNSNVSVIELKTKYPQGGEKQLIKAILGKEVPPNKLPIDIGCVVFNVDTCAALYRAVTTNMPLTKRIVTVSGTRVIHSHNLIVRIGTPIAELFKFCGGFTIEPKKVIVGGPMLGITVDNLDVPIEKSSIAVLAFGIKDDHTYKNKPCIRCGMCVRACPMNLMPNLIEMYANKAMYKECNSLNVTDCIECGCCAYVCPSRLNLVQTIRETKQNVECRM